MIEGKGGKEGDKTAVLVQPRGDCSTAAHCNTIIHPSIHSFIYPSIHLSIDLSIDSIYLSIMYGLVTMPQLWSEAVVALVKQRCVEQTQHRREHEAGHCIQEQVTGIVLQPVHQVDEVHGQGRIARRNHVSSTTI